MQSIEVVQKSIVYLEDHLLTPFTLDDMSDYLEESAFHINQSFTMITGMNIDEYVYCRKMTEAAKYLLNGNYRLVDVAEKYGFNNAHEFSTAFSEFHSISPLQARSNPERLKMQERIYLQLSVTQTPPMHYKIKPIDNIEIVGKSIRLDNEALLNHFFIPDLIYNENRDGLIDTLLKISSDNKLYVTLQPVFNGVQLFLGVKSPRTYEYESSFIHSMNYAIFHSRGNLDYIFNEIWHSIERQVDLQINYLRNEQYIYVFPGDYAFDNDLNKVELLIPVSKA
ncbi:helix-turn-helix domain-containing protein [Macrococcus armenti]|uniref:helix-turn-helix domain-containing protein n=1 Tax=Macrococcus armenti TaxID=2875764 RepID=UPI001CCAC1F6|nr:helix-turn-helix domain-containing protein [Macrococcus armenti]UBH12254.1 AraC family transcriptional regulator [Macrococcus armenti]